MPIHLRAKTGDYAPTVLLVGDPARAEKIAGILKNSRLVNKNRGLLGYTGAYKDNVVSVQTTGMGCPSAAIVVEELMQLDAKRFIRIGTCGGIAQGIRPLDIVIPLSATPYDGTTRTYLAGSPHAPCATFEILKNAWDVAQEMAIKPHFGVVASVDVFYNPFSNYVENLRNKGMLAVEMETSLIYYLANRNNLESASFLLVSDIVGGGEEFTKFVSDEDLQNGMDKMIRYVLEVIHRGKSV